MVTHDFFLAPGLCIKIARVAITKYHKLGDLNNRNALPHNSGGFKSKIKVSGGSVPSEAVRECLFYASHLASGGFLAIFGILGL